MFFVAAGASEGCAVSNRGSRQQSADFVELSRRALANVLTPRSTAA
jgi:hypothetical protein